MEREHGPHEGDELAEFEEQQTRARADVRPHVVHEIIRRAGELELRRSSGALAWSGLAAGLSMGFSLVGEGLLRAHLPDARWAPLVAHLGYTLGFIFVIIARQQLFTENTLTSIIPLLSARDRKTLANVARLWAVVLATNLVGAFAFALAVAHVRVFDEPTRAAFAQVAERALAGSAGATFVRAIFAGWLIALMVWMLPAVEGSRVAVIALMSYVVGLAELPHVIGGASETLYAVVTRQTGFWHWSWAWLLPTLGGNVVGGVALVSAVNHAQVVTGEAEGPTRH